MRDLDHAAVFERGVHAPVLPLPPHVAEAGAHSARQVGARPRVIEERAAAVPYLTDEVRGVVIIVVVIVVVARIEPVSGRDAGEGLLAQRKRELLKLVVEQLVHVLAGFEKARGERCHGRERERGDEPDQEPPADRGHGLSPIM